MHCVACVHWQHSCSSFQSNFSPCALGWTMLWEEWRYVSGDVLLTVLSHSNGRTPDASTVVEVNRCGDVLNSQLYAPLVGEAVADEEEVAVDVS